MAINRPVSKTIISTVQWGIPITDEVNRLAGLVDGNVPTAWITASPMQNGWVAYDARVPQYRKIGDIVYLRGVIKSGALGSQAFTLPVGYRPPSLGNLGFAVESNSAFGLVNIEPSGLVMPVIGQPTAYIRLDNIYFSTI